MTVTWSVPREWPEETVFVIGGGPSVSYQPVHRLEGRRVIAVNSAYETAPFADFCFFGDNRWWNEHYPRPLFKTFLARARAVTVSAAAEGKELLRLRRIIPPPGLSDDPSAAACQRTSLQGGMNLAYLLGARRIVLLGADACRAPDNRSHHHLPHKWHNKPGNQTWDIQMTQLQLIVAPLIEKGIEVFNTSPVSRLPYWPIVPLEEFLT